MRQLRILHLSDLHFGDQHRCVPDDPTHPRAGYPSVIDLVSEDLKSEAFRDSPWTDPDPEGPTPLIVAVTGDVTETASTNEFTSAYSVLSGLRGATLLGTAITTKDLFLVPGNHDVNYADRDPRARFTPYADFYNKLYEDVRPPILPEKAAEFSQLHVDEARGLVVAEINSAYYVQKATPDALRGSVDMAVIKSLRQRLEAIPETMLGRMTRVALLHHHPILVPALVEPGRGYDAVVNSNHLLRLLRDFGFHLVLHGHKHYPHVFSYDTDSPWSERPSPATFIVAGGSTSSKELPSGGRRCNTYNVITIRWHPEARQARIGVVTRGLVAEDGGGELSPDQWRWETLREIDRTLYPTWLPHGRDATTHGGLDDAAEADRKRQYRATRLNMVVSDVLPSFVPGQAYEVRAWIVPHVDQNGTPKPGWEAPERVLWSAGPQFRRMEVLRISDARYCCSYNYWGPMVVQADMIFNDGTHAYGYTYARIPGVDGHSA